MKNLLIAIYLTCLSLSAVGPAEAQGKRTVVDYYNLTKGEGEPKIVLSKGSWRVEGADESIVLTVADMANGYLEYEEQFGDGHSTISAALFLTGDKVPMLAVLDVQQQAAMCSPTEYVLKNFRMNGERMTLATDIVPSLSLELFLKKGYTLKKSERFKLPGSSLKIGYRLPQKGTTLEAFLYTSTLACSLENFSEGMTAEERDAVREFLKNVGKEPLKLKWNKGTGRFDPPGDK